MIKKAIAVLLCVSAVIGCAFCGCGKKKNDDAKEHSTTSFEEKVSYYDALAKVDGTFAEVTTGIASQYVFEGETDVLPRDVYERLVTVAEKCYKNIYAKYGLSGYGPKLTIVIDASYTRKDQNYTVGNTVVVNAEWLIEHTDDCDSLIYGFAGVALNFPQNTPKWLTESIKYYIRDRYAVFGNETKWKLPKKYEGGFYTDGNEVGAAFLKWIVQKYQIDIVSVIVSEIQSKSVLDDKTWTVQTGKTLGQLWNQYTHGE